MRRFTLFFLPILALGLVGCEDETPTEASLAPAPDFAMAGGVMASVAGSGHIPSGENDKRVFSFAANQRADGTVTGQFTLVVTSSVLGSENPAVTRIEAEVTCMTSWGNLAWVGGVVKSASNPEWVGKETGWAVMDNGEGGEGPDLISLMYIPTDPGRAQEVCDYQLLWPDTPVEGGNVQVRNADSGNGTFFPFYAWTWACDEPVEVMGFFHPEFRFRADRSDGFHASGHVNAHGAGIGLYSGTAYVWNEVYNYSETFSPPQATFTNQQSFVLIGRGDAPDLRARALFHVTVTPSGVVNVGADDYSYECS